MNHDRIKQLLLTICLAVSAMDGFASTDDATEPATPITAIWHTQRVELSFHSGTIYYSCDGLRAKIAAILKAVGAQEGVESELPCRRDTVTNQVVTQITITHPLEATAQNLEAATTYSTQAQLVARLNKTDLPTANDVQRFSAERRMVTLGSQRRLKLDGADCALLLALSEQVFPQLDVQVAKGRLSCSGNSGGRLRPKIQVMALVPTEAESVAYAGVGAGK
jgi:hypothetical protein